MTGCLNKQGADRYVFTSEKGGREITVMGSADLEKHSANHKVRLSGSMSGSGSDRMFHVTKVEHISASCEAKK